MHDLVIRNGTVVDGTAGPRFRADVAVTAGRVTEVIPRAARGREEIDAAGLVVAPGFIDTHSHDDRLLLERRDMAPKVSQGVTSVVAGNCGISLAPSAHLAQPVPPPLDALDTEGTWFRFPRFADYVEALSDQPPATNYALLVGHSSLRVRVMSDLARPAGEGERAEMRRLVTEALDAGAVGVSTGLFYDPARAAPTEEVIDVCGPLTQRRGVYCTHLRDEADGILDALAEAFRIGRELGVRIVLSHHKVIGRANHGRSRETLALIEHARREQDICLDCYPYQASSTGLRLDRARSSSKTLISWSKPFPEAAGRDLADVCAERGWSLEEALGRLSPGGGIYFAMAEEDVSRILSFEPTMVGSDGGPHEPAPHPRLWGTFPRVLGHYARDSRLFTLEVAVHKMTGLPARNFGLSGRGVLAPGMAADITLFDPQSVGDRATFEQPLLPAAGIVAVMVNGQCVWREGRATGANPGTLTGRLAGG